MDINVLDTNFAVVAVIDSFESILWNERYYSPGDFELYIPASNSDFAYLTEDYYLEIPNSDRTMIIESHEPQTDAEDGGTIIFRGRSLESILDRRIVWTQTTISGNVQNAVKKLLTDAIINPSIANRKISNFIFEDSDDTDVTSKTMNEAQFTGDNLLEVIEAICLNVKLGFKITLNESNQFVFKLYSGKNRTTSQNKYPHVVFSLDNDNLIKAKSKTDKSGYKNITLVAGEGEGVSRRTAIYDPDSVTGLNRREYFTDARDISSNEGTAEEISASDYTNLLIARGKEKLNALTITNEIEAEVDNSKLSMSIYKENYFMGDLVENVDQYGVSSTSRVLEFTLTLTHDEFSAYPIFENEKTT